MTINNDNDKGNDKGNNANTTTIPYVTVKPLDHDKASDLDKGIALLADSKAKRIAKDKADNDKGNGSMDKGNAKAIDKGKFNTHMLIDWSKQAYDLQKLDRGNGIVYHVKQGNGHKKLIKLATLENKQGLFFGAMLNSTMSDLAKDKAKNLTVYHKKSNVYKVTKATLTYANMVTLQKAIVKVCGQPKIAIGHGLTIDNATK